MGELELWASILSRGEALLPGVVLDGERDTMSSALHLDVSLAEDLTEAVLTRIPQAYYGGVDEVLLSALVLSVQRWRQERGLGGGGGLLVDLEGHGREALGDGVDVSRTVGWFTSLYPLCLEIGGDGLEGPDAGLGEGLKRVKDQVRGVADRGVGYGMLRYLDAGSSACLSLWPSAQVVVNYLGRLPQAEGLLGDASPWSGVGVGRGADDGMSLSHVLSLNAVTVGNRLVARWSWASRHLSRADVEALSEGWQEALSRLAADAALPGSGGHTPSDFTLVSLSQREIDLEEHDLSTLFRTNN